MALVACEECGREISDRAESCPHCGCPISKLSDKVTSINMYTYNGQTYDISEVYYYLNQKKLVLAIKVFRELTNASLVEAKNIVEILDNKPNKPTGSYTIKCPKCGSTDFDMVKRNWSALTGFMTNKVDRVCRVCKYKF
ncbi:hypothetical protein [Anaerosporobacter sp.]